MRDPWRPADIADAILGHSSRPPLPAVELLPGADSDDDIYINADEVFVMMLPTMHGRYQPVCWPMKFHRTQTGRC